MRIQILELPSEQVGDYYATPFAIVIDRLQSDETTIKSWADHPVRHFEAGVFSDQLGLSLKSTLGARGVIVSSEDVEIG